MVYLTFENHTEGEITFTFDSDYTGEKLYVNEYVSLYEREVYDQNPVKLASGQKLKLVLPNGAGFHYSVSGEYIGTKERLIVYNTGGDHQVVRPNAAYAVGGELIVDAFGQTVSFYDEDIIIPAPTAYHEENKPFFLLLVFTCFPSCLICFAVWCRKKKSASMRHL